MLSAKLKAAQSETIAPQRSEVERLRRVAAASSSKLASELAGCVNSGVATVYDRQKEIDSALRLVAVRSNQVAQTTQQWKAVFEQFNSALKQLGDAAQLAQVCEQDLRDVVQIVTAASSHEPAPADEC
jgi:uncharacterized phage infection (PIP) family protein YhgE